MFSVRCHFGLLWRNRVCLLLPLSTPGRSRW